LKITAICGDNLNLHTVACCPVCGISGKKVRPETIKNMVAPDRAPQDPEGYNLCLNGDCDVVYYGPAVFWKKDVRVRVWFKEREDTIPVCYCKGVTEKDIVGHIAVRGCCKDIEDIQRHTGANTGKECLVKNPAGT